MNGFVGKAAGVLALLAVFAVALFLGPSQPSAQPAGAPLAQQLVGTWTLISQVNTRPDGSASNTLGPNPKGMLIFTDHGRFMIAQVDPALPKFASGNRRQGTAEENKAVVQGSLSYFGAYSVDAAEKTVTYKIEGSSWPAWNGGVELKRAADFSGDELKLTNSAVTYGGTTYSVWRRIK